MFVTSRHERSDGSGEFKPRGSGSPTDVKHYGGILVVTDPALFDPTVAALNSLDGVEVHHTDPEQGRIIAVQESETLPEQEAGLRRIQQLPHVQLAELVVHRVDDPDAVNPLNVQRELGGKR
jgi:nitrate reductase NapAB chaperone NapD